MRAMSALIKREYLEHRIAFFYMPIFLIVVVVAGVVLLLTTGRAEFDIPAGAVLASPQIYEVIIAGIFGLWAAYLLIGLFFYYADAFSADRRNNALLFWKSMPQSDLKILTCKALSGITIFPIMIFIFAILTALIVWGMLLVFAAQHPFIAAPEPYAAVNSLGRMGVVGAAYFGLTLLWYAPLLAWVAGLSTLFRRWSIPLAVLIPAIVILLEFLNSLGRDTGRPIAGYLAGRFEGFPNEEQALALLTNPLEGPPALLNLILSSIDWWEMGYGLAFTAVIVILASEYRRRRIEA